jgi:diphthamide synthase (EF-2-diphthine--ammonia ligase)
LFLDPNRSKKLHQVGQQKIGMCQRLPLAIRFQALQNAIDRAGDVWRVDGLLTRRIPLWAVDLPWPCSNLEYEERMRAVCQRASAEGITAVAFGDLFLQDIRDYRVRQLQGTGLEPLFPVWQIPTEQLGRDMIAAGCTRRMQNRPVNAA